MATHVHSWDDIINANIDFTLETSGKNEVIWENDNEDLDAFYLIQGESNARALIFEMPRMVENHDNSLVDTVRIHYQNIGSTTQQSRGMYEVDVKNSDLFGVYPDENGEKIRFAWVITEDVTKYVGGVRFSVHLMCFDDDSNVAYDWTSGVCNDIVVVESVNVDGTITKENADIIRQWRNQLMFNVEFEPSNLNEQTILDKLVMTRTWDGKVFESGSLRGPQGIQGEQGIQGVQGEVGLTPTISIGEVTMQSADNPNPEVTVTYDQVDGVEDKTNPKLNFTLPTPSCDKVTTMGDDEELYFFKGTKAEYDQLTETEKKNVFAIITDDVYSTDQLEQDMAALKDANIIEAVKDNTYNINKVSDEVSRLSTSLISNNVHGAYNYEWYTDTSVSKTEPVNITFPSFKETWDDKVIYEYFDANEKPLNINDSGSNTETVLAAEDKECPSNYPNSWWGLYSETAGGGFDKDSQVSSASFVIRPETGFSEISSLSVTVDKITKDIPLDGSAVYFENTKTDAIEPNMYDGDNIRRIVTATRTAGSVYVRLSTSIYVSDAKPNKTISYDYDPQGKYHNAAKTIKHGLAIGANALDATYVAVSSKEPNTDTFESTGEPFYADITDFAKYMKDASVDLKVGDYLIDNSGALYVLLSGLIPEDGRTKVRLLGVGGAGGYASILEEFDKLRFGLIDAGFGAHYDQTLGDYDFFVEDSGMMYYPSGLGDVEKFTLKWRNPDIPNHDKYVLYAIAPNTDLTSLPANAFRIEDNGVCQDVDENGLGSFNVSVRHTEKGLVELKATFVLASLLGR